MMDHEGRAEPGPDREPSRLEDALRRLEVCAKRYHEIAERLVRASTPILLPDDPKVDSNVKAVHGPRAPAVDAIEHQCDSLDASSERIAGTIDRFDI